MRKIAAAFLLITTLFISGATIVMVPNVSYAQTGPSGNIIPCEGVPSLDAEGNPTNGEERCKFDHVMELINNVIKFLIFTLAPIIAALLLLYAGFLLLTSGGSVEKMGEAKKIFSTAVIGLLIALASWIIIKSIMIGLGYDDSYFPKFY